ncbi:MAG: hypothetical protein A4C66_09820 [Nitrospira sp. HN-bin3]|jgi:hypothetical protein|nr:MAG: hypothetical protein A4C66_09820 [Nitrospira sp. HN-bin3]
MNRPACAVSETESSPYRPLIVLQNVLAVPRSGLSGPVPVPGACLSVLLALVLLASAVPSNAQLSPSGSMRRSPADVVKRYVLLDQKGARLEAASFDTVTPYINWKEEPAWEQIVVVQTTTVSEDYRQWEIVNNLEVIIPVTFQVRGLVHLDTAKFVPEDRIEEVRFHVKVVGNYWRILSPVIPPHVGLKRMVSFARDAAVHEPDDTQRMELAALIESLRKAH